MIDHDNLEMFADPVNYDQEDPSDTGGPFYRALAREAGGPVLELACGTGRVAIPIAQMGYPVTGLDIVPAMIERAQRKSAGLPAQWVVGDARAFALGERFALIFLTGNAFQTLLTNADQAAMLQCVHAHLDDAGIFAFETRNPRWAGLDTDAEAPEGLFFNLETCTEEIPGQMYVDVGGYTVRTSHTQVYDPIAQLLHLTGYKRWHEGGEEHTQVTRLALRYTFPQELGALLQCHGFTIERRYGDWNDEPLAASSPSIIVVCRKRV